MAEYIEREAVYDALSGMDYYTPTDATRAISAVRAIPAADVVEVVRCGECANKFDWPWCGMFPDDGYCSAGARMDKDGDGNGV